MGLVRPGPPADFMLSLMREHGIETFVETGTYQGGTALWASRHFRRVVTIEFSETMHAELRRKYGNGYPNIDFRFGDSRTVLRSVVQTLEKPTLFWLDAHWCGGDSYGAADQCPLLDELRIINDSPVDHFLFIDDARLFLCPGPAGHKPDQWPALADVMAAVQPPERPRYSAIVEDVIICVPKTAAARLVDYAQQVSERTWQEYGAALYETPFRRSVRLLRETFRIWKDMIRTRVRR